MVVVYKFLLIVSVVAAVLITSSLGNNRKEEDNEANAVRKLDEQNQRHQLLQQQRRTLNSAMRKEVVLTWFAPLLSQSGYGKEAMEYVLSMNRILLDEARADDDLQRNVTSTAKSPLSDRKTHVRYLAAVNHGDSFDPAVYQGYPMEEQTILRDLLTNGNELNRFGLLSVAPTRAEDVGLPRGNNGWPSSSSSSFHELQQDRWRQNQRVAVAVCHSEPGAWALPRPLYETSTCPPWYANLAIARTMFETDRIPQGWVPRLNAMDQVWVPTEFHVNTFSRSGVDRQKLVVVPESIDTTDRGWSRTRCRVSRRPAAQEDGEKKQEQDEEDEAVGVDRFFSSIHRSKLHKRCRFKFLSVFKWEARKGWDVLVKAFYEEFIANTNPDALQDDARHGLVCLLLKTSAYHSDVEDGDDDEYDDQITNFLRKTYGAKFLRRRRRSVYDDDDGSNSRSWLQIHVVNEIIDASLFPLLYCGVDALVQPSRGEGWGRPHMEAMAMGVPVLATNWSGTTAFLNEHNGFPIEIEQDLVVIQDGAFKGHKWAEPRVDDLRRRMRQVVAMTRRNEALLAEKVQQARRDMVEHYDGEVVAKQMISLVDALVEKTCRDEQRRAAEKDTDENADVDNPADSATFVCSKNLEMWSSRRHAVGEESTDIHAALNEDDDEL